MKKRKKVKKPTSSFSRKSKSTAKSSTYKPKKILRPPQRTRLKKRVTAHVLKQIKPDVSYEPGHIALDTDQRAKVARFAGTPTIQHYPQETFHLPYRYYDDTITLMTRDPWWIYAYWDISQKKEKEILSRIPDDEKQGLKRTLRIYDVTGVDNFTGTNAKDFFDIEINDLALNWYINVDKPGRWFCVDIGFRSYKGTFFCLARSNIIKTPVFGISSILDEEWYLPDDEYFKMLGIYDLGKSSLERRRRLQEIFKKQISSLGASESFSPVKRKQVKKFFLTVQTEIILYGKTEPDAKVTLKGEKVHLKKDGTFSFRFALPEGNFEFPVEARSSSGKDTLKITPMVKRSTKEKT